MGLTLLTGAPLVLFNRFDAAVALELIERHRVTYTTAAITAFIALMDAPDAGERDTSSLRTIVSGGAPIAPATVEAFEQRFGTYIHNIYGLTETTSPSHCVPIGTPRPGRSHVRRAVGRRPRLRDGRAGGGRGWRRRGARRDR